MDSSGLIAAVSVLATLAAVGALGGSALVAAAYVNERAKRQAAELRAEDAEDDWAEASAENVTLKAKVKHLQFVRGNKLYSRAEQDLGFAANQSVIRLRVLKAEMEEKLTEIEKILDTEKAGR